MSKLELFFLSRYLKAPKRNLLRFSFVFMILGIILSVGILSAGLNLFEGYERTLKDVLLGAFPHLTISKDNLGFISHSEAEELLNKMANCKEIQQVTPVLSYPVMAAGKEKGVSFCLNRSIIKSTRPRANHSFIVHLLQPPTLFDMTGKTSVFENRQYRSIKSKRIIS